MFTTYYTLQLQQGFSLFVSVNASNIAPITAISVLDSAPSPENTQNTMSRNKYQLFSNIIHPIGFFITICTTIRQSDLFFSVFYMLICWYGNLTWFWNSNLSQKLSPQKRSALLIVRVFLCMCRCNTDKNNMRFVHQWNVCQWPVQSAFSQSNNLLTSTAILTLGRYCESKATRKNYLLFIAQQKDWKRNWSRCRISWLHNPLTLKTPLNPTLNSRQVSPSKKQPIFLDCFFIIWQNKVFICMFCVWKVPFVSKYDFWCQLMQGQSKRQNHHLHCP